MMSWNDWLNEPIDTVYGTTTRQSMIHLFVSKGLFPFIQSEGYEWNRDVDWIQSVVASGLYASQGKHNLQGQWPAPTNTDFAQEDIDQFEHTVDSDKWEAFWENWGGWDDVDADSQSGIERRLDIQAMVWQHIDVANSKQTKVVDAMFDDGEPQEDGGNGRRHEDVYIRDASESNEWGGYRR